MTLAALLLPFWVMTTPRFLPNCRICTVVHPHLLHLNTVVDADLSDVGTMPPPFWMKDIVVDPACFSAATLLSPICCDR
jgi:hypothetical protein